MALGQLACPSPTSRSPSRRGLSPGSRIANAAEAAQEDEGLEDAMATLARVEANAAAMRDAGYVG